jgi:hypothetical protein
LGSFLLSKSPTEVGTLNTAKSDTTNKKWGFEKEDGFAYRFPSDESLLADLFTLIQLEHQCCPFLKFTLIVEAGDGPVWLELTGPSGAKEFLNSILG